MTFSFRPDFYTLYLEEPDKSGHRYGPVSGGLIEALQDVDKIIGQLMNGLKQIGLHRCLNIVIVADHGMEETSCERKEVLQDLVGDIRNYWVTEGPFGRIRTKHKDTCKKPDQKIKPYLKANLPKRLHFANSRRIEDVNVLITPIENNGTHGSMNHVLREPYFIPAHPEERSGPTSCPLISLNPTDSLGCTCDALFAAKKKHFPEGRPRMLQPDKSYCVLPQEGFITAYSLTALMPLWSSFTIDKPVSVSMERENIF
ncbi:hypothetical protein F7725_025550 [Dissostichus mawsoni]|uniref:Uncharacterized protein n=1 Tax=Dissostichus mawsoni TaxID=36200 RepID=A0A7J5XBH2_DISMA|nr:hypothetical protein F7725_025550 [Dissostichus mawsoni]